MSMSTIKQMCMYSDYIIAPVLTPPTGNRLKVNNTTALAVVALIGVKHGHFIQYTT